MDILIDFLGHFSGGLKWHFLDFKMHFWGFGVPGLCRGTGRLQDKDLDPQSELCNDCGAECASGVQNHFTPPTGNREISTTTTMHHHHREMLSVLQYPSHVYRGAPPTCIAIRLPFFFSTFCKILVVGVTHSFPKSQHCRSCYSQKPLHVGGVSKQCTSCTSRH